MFYFGKIIRHYAGDVVYDICGFLDKNKDTLFQDFKRLLYGSKDANIRHMWPEGAQDIHKVKHRVKAPRLPSFSINWITTFHNRRVVKSEGVVSEALLMD